MEIAQSKESACVMMDLTHLQIVVLVCLSLSPSLSPSPSLLSQSSSSFSSLSIRSGSSGSLTSCNLPLSPSFSLPLSSFLNFVFLSFFFCLIFSSDTYVVHYRIEFYNVHFRIEFYNGIIYRYPMSFFFFCPPFLPSFFNIFLINFKKNNSNK